MEDTIQKNKTSKLEIVNYVSQKVNQEFEQNTKQTLWVQALKKTECETVIFKKNISGSKVME